MHMAAATPQRVFGVVGRLLCISFLWLAWCGVAAAEEITSFTSDITINADSSVLVTETIIYDFGTAEKHGIFREIPETHPQPASAWYKDRYIAYELQSVMRDGLPEPYVLQKYDGLSVKIGDANKTITGPHTYTISYIARGALAEYPEGTELYWNVTGSEWPAAIGQVSATIHAGSGVRLEPTYACYAGAYGSNAPCTSKTSSVTSAQFTQDSLAAGQQLTIAQRIVGVTADPQERLNDTLLLVFGIGAWFMAFGVWLYRWHFQFRTSRTVIPQYEPYQDFKPMFTGVLFDNRLDPRDITAGIIYLAQQGFISIRQTTDKVLFLFETNDYEIKLLKSKTEATKAYQKELISLLFHPPRVSFAEVFSVLFRNGAVNQGEEYDGTTIKLSELRKNTVATRKNYLTIERLRKAIKNDLVQGNFIQKNTHAAIVFMPIPLLLVVIPVLAWLQVSDSVIAVFVVVLMLSVFMFAIFGSERRTEKGYEALWHLKGFKQFLSVTEAGRYKFHNAPAKSPQQFMEYLPYAIAFGVEKEWAEVFKDIQIEPPSWYNGTTSSFNAVAFTSDIGSFANSFSAASTPPSSSGGSGGGGSAGGGGGGGGGGSW